MYYEKGCMNWVSGFLVYLLSSSMYVSVARLRFVYIIERCVFVVHGLRGIAPNNDINYAVLHPLRAVPSISVHSGFAGLIVYHTFD
jgi:hypothetical protein